MFVDGLRTPNHDLVFWLRIVTRKEPEEQLPLLIFIVRDGQKASVAFADVPRDIGKSTSVDSKRWILLGLHRDTIFAIDLHAVA